MPNVQKLLKISAILVLIFGLSFSQLTSAWASTDVSSVDKTAPTVNSISVDKPNAKAGDTVTFTVKASDGNGSELTDYGSLRLALNGSDYGDDISDDIALYSEKNNGVYTGSFTIPKYNANGKWTVSHIELSDSLGNSLYEPINVSDPLNDSAAFKVSDSFADALAPSIKSVEINKTSAKPGDKIHFTLKAADNEHGSGLSDDADIGVLPPGGQLYSLKYVDLVSMGNGVYAGDLTIGKDFNINGKWIVSSISVSDRAGNYSDKDLSPSDRLAVSFNVSGGFVDKTAPTIKSIKVNNQAPKPGDTVTFTITAADNSGGSGLSDNAELRINSDGQKNSNDGQDVDLTFNGKDQYVGNFKVPMFNSDGKWTISYIKISDNQDNDNEKFLTTSDPLNKFSWFTVKGSKIDKSAPKISNVTVDNQSPKAGDYINFTVSATDSGGSGLSGYGELELVHTGTNGKTESRTVYLYLDDDNQYSGGFSILKYGSNGKWTISRISISDVEDNEVNQSIKSNDPLNGTGSFTVSANGEDHVAPVVDAGSLKIDKTQAGPYDRIHFTLNASDTGGSGFTEDTDAIVTLSCNDINGKSQTDSVYLRYDGDNHFSGYYRVPKYNSDGKWAVTNIELSDAAGNEYNKTYSGKLSFNAIGSTKIAVQKVNVSKQYPKSGDLVHLSVKPVFSGGGPSWSIVLVATQNGVKPDYYTSKFNGIYYDLDYNSTNQDYEGDYQVPNNLPEGEYRIVTTCPINGKYSPGYPGTRSTDLALFRIDRTAPKAPTVNAFGDNATSVTGKAEAGAKITVKDNKNAVLGTATTASNGSYTLKLGAKQKLKTILTAYATDAAGNTSTAATFKVVDKTTPGKPSVATFGDNSTAITGKAEAGAKITIKDGKTVLSSTTATSKGTFTVTIKTKQPSGKNLTAYATDAAGNTSAGTSFKVVDKTAPGKPSVNTFGNNSTTITGKAEAGSKVTIKYDKTVLGSATATSKGIFTIKIKNKQPAGRIFTAYATDKSGNTSTGSSLKVADKIAPSVPSVNKVTYKSTAVQGKAEKGATVYLYYGKRLIGKATVNSKGVYSLKIRKQKKGTKLTLFAKDTAGNKSKSITVKVY